MNVGFTAASFLVAILSIVAPRRVVAQELPTLDKQTAEEVIPKKPYSHPGNQEWAQQLAQVYAQRAPNAASPEDNAGEKSYPLRVTLKYAYRRTNSGATTTIAQQATITNTESQDKYRADIECDGILRRVSFPARWNNNEHKEMKLPATEGGSDKGHEVSCKIRTLTKQPQ